MLKLLSTLCLLARTLNSIPSGGSDDSIRVKRVISGTSVVDLNSEYKAVRYFVWLGDGERCDALSIEDVKKFLELEDKNSLTAPFASCAPNTETAFCGGSLLTSTIVQTACHCLVTFEGVKDGFQLPVTHRVWENMYDVYPGAVPVKMASGVKSRHYIRHPKCTQHFETGKVLHDYALIVLRSPLLAKKILHAPVYTINALTQIWTESMAKRAICMELGFGRYRLTDTNEPEPSRSEFLRHGWVRTMDYEWCYNRSSLPAKFKEGRWNYSQDATWLCTRTLPGRGQHHAPGDSGSPTTCNNQYAGLVASGVYSTLTWRFYYSMSMSTAFSIFENSAEYRQAMTESVGQYDKIDKKTRVLNYRPSSPPIRPYFNDQL